MQKQELLKHSHFKDTEPHADAYTAKQENSSINRQRQQLSLSCQPLSLSLKKKLDGG